MKKKVITTFALPASATLILGVSTAVIHAQEEDTSPIEDINIENETQSMDEDYAIDEEIEDSQAIEEDIDTQDPIDITKPVVENVAKNDETYYEVFDDAINNAQDGDVVELLSDVTSSITHITKSLTFTSSNNYTINFLNPVTFDSNTVKFENVNIESNNNINFNNSNTSFSNCEKPLNINGTLTINDSTITLSKNVYGIYGNNLVVNNSTINISDTTNDGIHVKSMDTKNSTFNIDNNQFGIYTNKINSNGSTFTMYNNKLSGLVIVSNSESSVFKNYSSISVSNTKESIYGAIVIAAPTTIKNSSTLSARTNDTTGVMVITGTIGTITGSGSLIMDESSTISLSGNSTSTKGGGIWTNSTVVLPNYVIISDNKAKEAGDDIYVENGTIVLKDLNSPFASNFTLITCFHTIDGWYEDGNNAEGKRWNGESYTSRYAKKVETGTLTGTLALKAAHEAISYKKITINYQTSMASADAIHKAVILVPKEENFDYTSYIQMNIKGYKYVETRTQEFTDDEITLISLYTVDENYTDDDIEYAAKIGDTYYQLFDDAYEKAKDGDCIEILKSVSSNITNFTKALTIQASKDDLTSTITFNTLTNLSNSLTLKNVKASIENTIQVAKNCIFTLENVKGSFQSILFEGNNEFNINNESKVSVNGSITCNNSNYALKTNMNHSSLNVAYGSIQGNIDLNIDTSNVYVSNSAKDGINVNSIYTKDSALSSYYNENFGIKAGKIISDNSTIYSCNNKSSGIILSTATQNSIFENKSKVMLSGNNIDDSTYGSFLIGANVEFKSESSITSFGNKATGILVLNGRIKDISGYGFLIMDDSTQIHITNNQSKYGGGIWTNSKVILPTKTTIYKNTATIAGDDIYVDEGGSIALKNNVGDYLLLEQNHLATEWYEDGNNAQGKRWEADDKNNLYLVKYEPGIHTGKLALKAADGFVTYKKTTIYFVLIDTLKDILDPVIIKTTDPNYDYSQYLKLPIKGYTYYMTYQGAYYGYNSITQYYRIDYDALENDDSNNTVPDNNNGNNNNKNDSNNQNNHSNSKNNESSYNTITNTSITGIVSKNGVSTNNTSSSNSSTNSVNTSVQTNVNALLGLMAISLAGVLIARKED